MCIRDSPVTDLTQQQLRDIYAGKITNWKDVGGQDLDIVAFQRRSDSGSQTPVSYTHLSTLLPHRTVRLSPELS